MARRQDDRNGKRGKRDKYFVYPPRTEAEAEARLRRINDWMRRKAK